jgi:hypothetical protein
VPWLLAKAVADAVYSAATGLPPVNPVPCLKGFGPLSEPEAQAELVRQVDVHVTLAAAVARPEAIEAETGGPAGTGAKWNPPVGEGRVCGEAPAGMNDGAPAPQLPPSEGDAASSEAALDM